ncbi:MAG: hypothetical protein JRL30_01105 [Deltaproteobacteria bacterium]|nr:hypothetical protein [Deltaproteobacteria bacterium]
MSTASETRKTIKWLEKEGTKLEKRVAQEMFRSVQELDAAAKRRVPVSANIRKGRGKKRTGAGVKGRGGHMKNSIFSGMLRRGRKLIGFVGTPQGWKAQFTEIQGANKRINVGTAEFPTTMWDAKKDRGEAGVGGGGLAKQTMPWLQPAWKLDVQPGHIRRMRKV